MKEASDREEAPKMVEKNYSTGFRKAHGEKDQSVTKPISLDGRTGEVIVRKSTGKTKIRKGQTEEEYTQQLQHYFEVEQGPVRTKVGWMDEVDPLVEIREGKYDISNKHQRQVLSGFCHRLFYQRKYKECLELSTYFLGLFEPFNVKNKMKRELEELEYMIERCRGHVL
ncbi:ASN_HP2_G0052140.mRNA.1.CDS.1 [Saccharomyces cerevisiae]|nr:ASN_HP2_G0052140.mRNA.1.CDS.1 [Saccharomyces cerevisiae]CAI6722272.1 ASN_HP2_G0052140.mRNA.1.CDS.1 [Saccharomyces cerevisiae]CAI6734452.1 ASN_HP1_G0053330.mRNA.1.CDS.1 [Saccharomyces cerevisiae]CAI7381477.1 ASN_collapsed_G0055220.mRNA.1.CDS.1 [Saccharomyces cerevisiae]